jgi:hypothetical protein
MMDDDFGCRPPEPPLCGVADEANIAIDNAAFLTDHAFALAKQWSAEYYFTSDWVRRFNEIAMRGIYASAGNFRDRYCAPPDFPVPSHRDVPRLVDEMCAYANAHRHDPFHTAAYLLWRTNWIHPFYDGNGRVSRELCHLAVLVHTGDTWDKPLPELIGNDPDRYFDGLHAADMGWDGETPQVNQLQDFITGLYFEHTIL